jgi:hypothetical protein
MNRELFFFHHSDIPRTWTTDVDPDHQVFLWFADRYNELSFIGSKYIYFFMINPSRDNVRLTARPYGGGFHGLFATHLMRHRDTDKPDPQAIRWSNEPPFVSTYSQVTPKMGAEFDSETEEYTVLFPQEHAGKRFKLFDRERRRIPFLEVPTLKDVFPLLEDAYPFAQPPKINDQFFYPDWVDEFPSRVFDIDGFEREKLQTFHRKN